MWMGGLRGRLDFVVFRALRGRGLGVGPCAALVIVWSVVAFWVLTRGMGSRAG